MLPAAPSIPSRTPAPVRSGQEGFVLLALVVFILVVITVCTSLFAMASYETKAALYRQHSHEAFNLAEGALERARAKLLEDRSWRDGWDDAPVAFEDLGTSATYDLAISDTSLPDLPQLHSPVCLRAEGHVGNAHRAIEAIADLPPTGFDMPLFVKGTAEIGGNLRIEGATHVNEDATGNKGHGDPHIVSEEGYTEGFELRPPIIYTDPDHFPDATYYYVKGTKVGSACRARIFDRHMNDITGTVNMAPFTSYDAKTKTYTYNFNTAARIAEYFHPTTGVFRMASGDNSIVVNFGELPLGPSGALYQALNFDGGKSVSIPATVINSRFAGSTTEQRLDTGQWDGATIMAKQVKFEPLNGIALICHDLKRNGSSHAYLGTAAHSALVYLTRDVVTINSNLHVYGALICLGDFHSSGGPDIIYDSAFLASLPSYLLDGWTPGVSGTLRIYRWRETAAS